MSLERNTEEAAHYIKGTAKKIAAKLEDLLEYAPAEVYEMPAKYDAAYLTFTQVSEEEIHTTIIFMLKGVAVCTVVDRNEQG